MTHPVLETDGVGLFGTRHGGRTAPSHAVILAEISRRLLLFRIKWILFCPGGQKKVTKWCQTAPGLRKELWLGKHCLGCSRAEGINDRRALNVRHLLWTWRVSTIPPPSKREKFGIVGVGGSLQQK